MTIRIIAAKRYRKRVAKLYDAACEELNAARLAYRETPNPETASVVALAEQGRAIAAMAVDVACMGHEIPFGAPRLSPAPPATSIE